MLSQTNRINGVPLPFDAAEQSRRPAVQPRPLRVLQVAMRYFPYMGGVETHTYEVARRLAQQGVDVTVLTTDTSGKLPAREVVEDVQIQRVRAWPANGDLFFAPGLYRVITGGHWDVVHCQGIHTLVTPLAMLAAWRAKVPYVVTFHTGGHGSRLRNALRGLQWAALRPLLNHAARLIGVAKFEAELFQRALHLPKSRFTIIRNGAQLPQVPKAPAEISGETLIVSVGRLERYKGHHRMIEALPLIRAQFPDVRLLILGSGPYEGALRQLAGDLGIADQVEIRMIPPAQRQEMAAVVARAALMTLLSEYEAHPIAVMEAVALKRSVLVADTSGFRELAEEGLVRTIPLTSTVTEVAAAVVHQLRHPLVPPQVSLPTWDTCVAELQALYSGIARSTQCAS